MPIDRDPRPLNDQIIDHDLVGLPPEKMVAILIIEIRRLREQITSLAEDVRRGPVAS